MSVLTIANTVIRRDAAGRYCLNDLHRAAGGESKHQPGNWLRMQQTTELVAEVEAQSIPQIRGIESKQGLGTFVSKELVYGFAECPGQHDQRRHQQRQRLGRKAPTAARRPGRTMTGLINHR